MKRYLIMSLSVLLLMAATVHARQADSLSTYQEKLFMGVRAGMPMAEADFSSFGADRFRPSWSLGINAGYRFTDVLSLELSANWGQLYLGEKGCCLDYQYFLGSDMNRYHPDLIPEGMSGQYYRDIKNITFTQRYGLQMNMNILGFFRRTKTGPWRLELAPAIYAVGTSSDIVTKKDRTPFVEDISKWHLGYGGLLQATYAINRNMNIGLYGGYTQVTGKQMDGMPGLHTSNFIIDAGVRFTFSLIKKKRAVRPSAPAAASSVQPSLPSQQVQPSQPSQPVQADEEIPFQNLEGAGHVTQPEEAVASDRTDGAAAADRNEGAVAADPAGEAAPAGRTDKAVTEDVDGVTEPAPSKEAQSGEAQPSETQVEDSRFPIIYFSFNSIWIEPSERGKVKEIAEIMKADKSIRVRVTGWCDPVGSEEANKRVSLQRAEAVKRVLGQWLVPADRIETVGGGIKKDAASDSEARNATTIEIF